MTEKEKKEPEMKNPKKGARDKFLASLQKKVPK